MADNQYAAIEIRFYTFMLNVLSDPSIIKNKAGEFKAVLDGLLLFSRIFPGLSINAETIEKQIRAIASMDKSERQIKRAETLKMINEVNKSIQNTRTTDKALNQMREYLRN